MGKPFQGEKVFFILSWRLQKFVQIGTFATRPLSTHCFSTCTCSKSTCRKYSQNSNKFESKKRSLTWTCVAYSFKSTQRKKRKGSKNMTFPNKILQICYKLGAYFGHGNTEQSTKLVLHSYNVWYMDKLILSALPVSWLWTNTCTDFPYRQAQGHSLEFIIEY